METQTRLSRHNKFISAENIIALFFVSSDDSLYIYINMCVCVCVCVCANIYYITVQSFNQRSLKKNYHMIGTGNDVLMCGTSWRYNGLKDDKSKNFAKTLLRK